MEFSRVDKKAKKAWRFSRFIGLLFILLISGCVMLGVMDSTEGSVELMLLAGIICGVLVLLQLINIFIYPIIEYIQWAYLITDDRIEIKKGIIFKQHTIVPVDRIQHVCSSEGPIQRLYKLATVQIHTAGGDHQIVHLSKSVADELCSKLQNEVSRKLAARNAALMGEVK